MKIASLRKNKGALVCLAGVLCNLLLAAGKIAVGFFTGLLSVTADGFNNLSDCGSGTVVLLSCFIAEKPADRHHPFGHRRAEYLASMIAGLFVCFLAAELLRGSIESVIRAEASEAAPFVYLVLGISVLVKLGMFALYSIAAKKLDSKALKAAATDSLCDSLATAAVILGTALCAIAPSADGWTGLLVSLFIGWQGIRILADASSELLGRAPAPALAEHIKAAALSTEGVLGVHDLQIYGYGKGVSFATLHVEMDSSLSMLSAHAVIDGLEARIRTETGVRLTVHLDPVDLANREESLLRIKIGEEIRELAEGSELHDLRILPNTEKVEFDVSVPFACKRTDGELEEKLAKAVRELGPYEPVIRIDRE